MGSGITKCIAVNLIINPVPATTLLLSAMAVQATHRSDEWQGAGDIRQDKREDSRDICRYPLIGELQI